VRRQHQERGRHEAEHAGSSSGEKCTHDMTVDGSAAGDKGVLEGPLDRPFASRFCW
jgi:hypothetical protein